MTIQYSIDKINKILLKKKLKEENTKNNYFVIKKKLWFLILWLAII